MPLGLSRREQWALLATMGVVVAGFAVQAARQPATLGALGVDATGRWEKLAEFQAGAGQPVALLNAPTSSTVLQAGRATPPAGTSTGKPGGLDLNLASASDLDRLPGVGAVKARDILALRAQRGRFDKIEDLLDVKGIGPATLEKLRPYVFVAPRAANASTSATAAAQRATARATTSSLHFGVPQMTPPTWAPDVIAATPTASAPRPAAAPTGRARAVRTPAPMVEVNAADLATLQKLVGIGPVLAQRIIDERRTRGPFRSMNDLVERVKGIGPATAREMQGQAIFR